MKASSKSSEANSSLGSDVMNQISLDVLFSNLNKSLKNKFASQRVSNPNCTSNQNSAKQSIDFFKFNQNTQSSSINSLPTNQNYSTTNLKVEKNEDSNGDQANSNSLSESFKASLKKDLLFKNFNRNNVLRLNDNCQNNSRCTFQSHDSDQQTMKSVQISPMQSIPVSNSIPPLANSTIPPDKLPINEIKTITSNNSELPGKASKEQFSQIKPILPPSFTFNSFNSNTMHQQNYGLSPFLRQYSKRITNADFRNIKLSLSKLNFLPSEEWNNTQGEVNLDSLISSYFRVRCSSKIRFEHKLWNALQITLYMPQLYSSIGVKWASKTIIQVNQEIFGNFLDLKKVISALFTSNGLFPSHGFVEIPDSQVRTELNGEISDNDLTECRFLEHRNKLFKRDSNETEIASIQLEDSAQSKP